MLSTVAASAQQTPRGAAPAPSISVEEEVLGNIRAQTIGPATVGDLALPEPFLRRVADRIVRSSFEDRFRIVVSDDHARAATAPADAATPARSAPDAPIETRQVLLWACIAGFVAVFAGLVVKGRRGRTA